MQVLTLMSGRSASYLTVQPSPQEAKGILVDQQQGRGVAGELIVAEEDEQFGEEAQAEDDVEEGLGPFQQTSSRPPTSSASS